MVIEIIIAVGGVVAVAGGITTAWFVDRVLERERIEDDDVVDPRTAGFTEKRRVLERARSIWLDLSKHAPYESERQKAGEKLAETDDELLKLAEEEAKR